MRCPAPESSRMNSWNSPLKRIRTAAGFPLTTGSPFPGPIDQHSDGCLGDVVVHQVGKFHEHPRLEGADPILGIDDVIRQVNAHVNRLSWASASTITSPKASSSWGW